MFIPEQEIIDELRRIAEYSRSKGELRAEAAERPALLQAVKAFAL